MTTTIRAHTNIFAKTAQFGLVFGLGLTFFLTTKPLINQVFSLEEPGPDARMDTTVSTQADSQGNRQVVLDAQGQQKMLSTDAVSNSHMNQEERYVVWMGQLDSGWQIFAYDNLSKETFQLTHLGSNVNPVTSGSSIAWESQINGIWHAVLFDGERTQQISTGTTPIQQLQLEKDFIAYLQQSADGLGWTVTLYDLKNNTFVHIGDSGYASELHLDRGILAWTPQQAPRQFFRTRLAHTFPSPSPQIPQAQTEGPPNNTVEIEETTEEPAPSEQDEILKSSETPVASESSATTREDSIQPSNPPTQELSPSPASSSASLTPSTI